MEKEIKEKMAEILEVGVETLADDMSIEDIPEWDSMRYLEVLMGLGKKYGIKYTREELIDVETVGDMLELTKEKIG